MMRGDSVDTLDAARPSAVARLERLPIGPVHRDIVWLLGFLFFFELGDINTFAYAAPAILKAWNLSIVTIGFITSATFVGMFVGATGGGWFSDRVGRKRALVATTVWYSACSLLNAVVVGPTSLFAARLLTGMGLSAMTVVGITYISEMFPATHRGRYQGWVMTVGLIGIPATAYVARFCIPYADWGWRLVFVWGSFGLLFPIFADRIEESPRWYENQGRFRDADDVLERIERRTAGESGELPPVASAAVSAAAVPRAHLLGSAYRSRTIVLMTTWICQTLGFYGFMAWVPTLLVAHGFSLVHSLAWSSAMSLGAVPGALIAALVADRWQRKHLITVVALTVGGCGLIYGLSFRTVTIVVFGFLVAMFLQTFAPLLYAYTAECYPTEIRNSGTGLAYGIGRLANVFGPLIIAFLFVRYGYTSVFVYIAVVWACVALMIGLFGPSTRGRVLA